MRRDQLSAEVRNVEWVTAGAEPVQPHITITFDGTKEELKRRFRTPGSGAYTPAELEMFYRMQSSTRPSASRGVVTLSDRITGDLLIEVAVSPDVMEVFLSAAREYATVTTESQYEVRIRIRDQEVAAFELDTLLVYGTDGTLLRHRSLIPDEIEI